MAMFDTVNKAPGVYIQELLAPGPIAGVSTSTAAFMGPAQRGPIGTPTPLTNFGDFTTTFGGYLVSPPMYSAYAVRGFFENMGGQCFFVRVGSARNATLSLNDRAAPPRATLQITAHDEGSVGNGIIVEVLDSVPSLGSNRAVKLEVALASASGSQATLANPADAANFRVGDVVALTQLAHHDQTTVTNISGSTLHFSSNVANTYDGGTVRLADISGANPIRLDNPAGFESGSYVTITQGATTEGGVVQAVNPATHAVTLSHPLHNTYGLGGADAEVLLSTQEFTLRVTSPRSGLTEFAHLAMDPRHSRYVMRVVKSSDVDVAPPATPNVDPPPANLPALLAQTNLAGGHDDVLSDITSDDYQAALTALEPVDVSLVCAPDGIQPGIQAAIVQHCETHQDRFAILDSIPHAARQGLEKQLKGDPAQGLPGLASSGGYAALYYPWIQVDDGFGGLLTVPPSGHVAGIFARTDTNKGVHKAPANEQVLGARGLELVLTDAQQGPLNEEGINVLRGFPGRGVVVWGARTTAPADVTQWRYINVRRLLIFIEQSVKNGTRFAVFEPNGTALWAQVRRQVSEFLTRVWQDGALAGTTAERAFAVRVDATLNPPGVIALGQLVIEVIVYPLTPAEFVVFRVIQQPGGPQVRE